MPRPWAGLAVTTTVALLTTSCALARSAAEQPRDAGGDLTARAVRACLDKRTRDRGGLLFRTMPTSSRTFVGVVMMDRTPKVTRTATVGIAIYHDAEFLDAYEQRAREDPEDEVTRVQNAVVSSNGPFSGRLARAERWVDDCLR